ncbi:MAG: hypothetical protein Q8K86_08925 [Candidatus Nanopelagicaceae bacterium]|nr:hypothetical protein [Candidatus Nanopelagicaceae bacterium]
MKKTKTPPKDQSKDQSAVEREKIEKMGSLYAERMKKLIEPIGKHLDKMKIELAVVVVIDPQTKLPMPIIKGNEYEAAKLTKFTYEQLVERMEKTLTLKQ